MFNNQEISKTSEDTNVYPTLDENANKKYDEIAQIAYEIIVNNDEDVPMLCVTKKKVRRILKTTREINDIKIM